MADVGKVVVTVDATYNNGDVFYEDQKVPARVLMQDIPGAKGYMEVALRMVVCKKDAEEFFEGIKSAQQVEVLVHGMKPPLERG